MKIEFENGYFRVETVIKDGVPYLKIKQEQDGYYVRFITDEVKTIDSIIEELTWAKAKIQEKNRVRKHGTV